MKRKATMLRCSCASHELLAARPKGGALRAKNQAKTRSREINQSAMTVIAILMHLNEIVVTLQIF